MEKIDDHNDIFKEFEYFLKQSQADNYLRFYYEICFLERSDHLDDTKRKKLIDTIISQYLIPEGSESLESDLLGVDHMTLNEIKEKRSTNPTPNLFNNIKTTIGLQLDTAYSNFLTQ